MYYRYNNETQQFGYYYLNNYQNILASGGKLPAVNITSL